MRNPLLLGAFTLIVGAALYLRMIERRAVPDDPGRRAILAAGRAVVAVAVADLYTKPEEGAALTDQVLLGHTVTVASPQPPSGPFLRVETAEKYQGYARAAVLVPLPRAAPPYEEGGPLVTVRSRFANVYGEPDVTRHNPLLVAPLGVRLRLLAEVDGRWLKLRLPDGREGFIHRGDVTLSAPPPFTAACVVGEALRHEGTPYLWGGRSTFGIDCSGLSANAYRACGTLIPRDADLQHGWEALQKIEQKDAQPGDLIFFGGAAKGAPPKVTHVAVYLGQDEFVHATTSERPTVHRSRLSEGAWQQILVGIRRHPNLVQ